MNGWIVVCLNLSLLYLFTDQGRIYFQSKSSSASHFISIQLSIHPSIHPSLYPPGTITNLTARGCGGGEGGVIRMQWQLSRSTPHKAESLLLAQYAFIVLFLAYLGDYGPGTTSTHP